MVCVSTPRSQLGWLQQEHRFWSYKPLGDRIHELSTPLQRLLGWDGFASKRDPDNQREVDAAHWVPPGAHAYLSRTAEQVLVFVSM